MKVLLVGSSSALASVLLPKLKTFAEVICAGRSEKAPYHINLTSEYELPAEVDTLIHLAADFGGPDADSLLRAEQTNAIGTLRLYQKSTQARVKHFIYISSIYSTLPVTSHLYSAYALSKKHAEDLLLFSSKTAETKLTILRPGPFYGAGPNFKCHQPFLQQIIDKTYKGEDIELYGTHDALRNYLHVEDLAAVLAQLVIKQTTGVYSCLALQNISLISIAETAAEVFNSRSRVHFNPAKADIPDIIFPPDDTLYRELDCFPKLSFRAGMVLEAEYRRAV